MGNDDISIYLIPLGGLLLLVVVFFLLGSGKNKRIQQRIARVTNRKKAFQKNPADSLRRKSSHAGLPFIGKLLGRLSLLAALRSRLERAGLQVTADIYIAVSAVVFIAITALSISVLGKPPATAVLAALLLAVGIPHMVVGFRAKRRLKKFLTLFPDAIDFIVRGLRSGLPVTESMNMVGVEMEQPLGGIFANMGESVRLGVTLEKALQDMARKLGLTEFSFFVTSIILQRETGGNLSEILTNLSDVLRKRFMMRMKIKAMSSEAKASAIIVGSLPFVVILALTFVAPGYLDPLIDDRRGNMAAAGAAMSMLIGIAIMAKMTRFEI